MEDLLIPLTFPQIPGRPYFFTSFVSTMDGKIFVNRPGYWPIGSRDDWTYYTWVRAHADAIVEGKNTALRFGSHMIKTLTTEPFLSYRKKIGKTEPIKFFVMTTSPDAALKKALENPYGFQTTILTPQKLDSQFDKIADSVLIERNDEGVDIEKVIAYLQSKKYQNVLLDTGPGILRSFLEKHMLDELFITIAPKLFGQENEEALSIVNGKLFPPESIPEWKLLRTKQVGDEVFLRYRKDPINL